MSILSFSLDLCSPDPPQVAKRAGLALGKGERRTRNKANRSEKVRQTSSLSFSVSFCVPRSCSFRPPFPLTNVYEPNDCTIPQTVTDTFSPFPFETKQKQNTKTKTKRNKTDPGQEEGADGESAEIKKSPGLDPNAGPSQVEWADILNCVSSSERYGQRARSALHTAISCGHKKCVSMLLSAGVDTNIADADGITPLMTSLSLGMDKVSKDLLYIGNARVDAVNRWGDTVLKCAFACPAERQLRSSEPSATVSGTLRNVEMLLASGSDVTVSDSDGNFPLHWLAGG